MIKIELNKDLDKEMYLEFYDFKIAGVDFGGKIRRDHPTIGMNNYSDYIDDYYESNAGILEKTKTDTQNITDEFSEEYFKRLKTILGYDLSNQKYIGYLSIFDCNPRFLENGTFQVWYRKDQLNKIECICHEVMHFAFFKYYNENLKEFIVNNDEDSSLWELSEIFNTIVLNLPEFQQILKREELGYPSLKIKTPEIKKIWDIYRNDIPDFIKRGLDYLRSRS